MNTEMHAKILLVGVAILIIYWLIGVGIAWAYDEKLEDNLCGAIISTWIILVPGYLFVLLIRIIAKFFIRILKIK